MQDVVTRTDRVTNLQDLVIWCYFKFSCFAQENV